MRRIAIGAGLVLVAALGRPAEAQDPGIFEGKWKLEMERSLGQVAPPPARQPARPAGTRPRARPGRVSGSAPPPAAANIPTGSGRPFEQTLTVKVDKGVLQIEQVTGGTKETFKYQLDGTPSRNRHYLPPLPETTDVTSTSRWDGPRLVTEGELEYEFEETGETVKIHASETRYLTDEGATMVVETLVRIAGRPDVARRLVYSRQ